MGNIHLKLLQSLAFAAALLPACAHGQATASAGRTNSIDIYAGGSVVKTDYDSTDKGFLLGGDFGYHLHYFDASLDVRYNHATGSRVGEKDFAGGIKIAKPFGRYHPYADVLIGYGVITFDNPLVNYDGTLYSYDNSTIYDFGGGLDINLTRRFDVKFDIQDQSWNLGSRGNANSVSFNPVIASAGIVFHLPYRFLRPRRY